MIPKAKIRIPANSCSKSRICTRSLWYKSETERLDPEPETGGLGPEPEAAGDSEPEGGRFEPEPSHPQNP